MKYLKRFEKENEYLSYVESDSFLLPNVSLIDEFSGSSGEGAKFNPLPKSNDDSFNGYEYVDLGLPSGLKWAKCNIGAEKESDYGLYFAWGEVEGYKDASSGKEFSGDDYKWNEGGWQYDGSSITKYNLSDSLTTLLPEDDAATVNMGGPWRMPSKKEYLELIDNTTNTWTAINGVNGILFTGNNRNTLFLPASGYCYWGSVFDIGSYGYGWSSSLIEDYPSDAWCLYFGSGGVYVSSDYRYHGRAVRGVIA